MASSASAPRCRCGPSAPSPSRRTTPPTAARTEARTPAATATDPNAYYRKGDVVTFNLKKYAAKVDHASDGAVVGAHFGNPDVNTLDWQGESEGREGTDDSVNGADSVAAGGGNGYQSVFTGTTASGPSQDAWNIATPYAVGDAVSWSGYKYVAQLDQHRQAAGHSSRRYWKRSDGESRTNGRIVDGLVSPQSQITVASPGSGLVTGRLRARSRRDDVVHRRHRDRGHRRARAGPSTTSMSWAWPDRSARGSWEPAPRCSCSRSRATPTPPSSSTPRSPPTAC